MARAVIITSYLEHTLDLTALCRPDDFIVCLDGGYDIAQSQGLRPDLLLGDFDSLSGDIPSDPSLDIRRFPPEKDYSDLELAYRLLNPEVFTDLLVIGGLGGRLDQTVCNIEMLARYTAPGGGKPGKSESAPGAGKPGKSENAPGSGNPARADAALRPEPVRPAVLESLPSADPLFRRIEMIDGRNRCFVIRAGGSAQVNGDCCPDGTSPIPAHRIPKQDGYYLSLFSLSEECRGLTLRGTKYPLEDAVLQRGRSLGVSNEFLPHKPGPDGKSCAELSLREGTLLVVISAR